MLKKIAPSILFNFKKYKGSWHRKATTTKQLAYVTKLYTNSGTDYLINCLNKSTGSGKIIVEFFSADIELRVWR